MIRAFLLRQVFFLEGRGDGEPESLPRFFQTVIRGVNLKSTLEGEITRRARGEHLTLDQALRTYCPVQKQRIISVVDAEWRVHNRQDHLQFQPCGHARYEV